MCKNMQYADFATYAIACAIVCSHITGIPITVLAPMCAHAEFYGKFLISAIIFWDTTSCLVCVLTSLGKSLAHVKL